MGACWQQAWKWATGHAQPRQLRRGAGELAPQLQGACPARGARRGTAGLRELTDTHAEICCGSC